MLSILISSFVLVKLLAAVFIHISNQLLLHTQCSSGQDNGLAITCTSSLSIIQIHSRRKTRDIDLWNDTLLIKKSKYVVWFMETNGQHMFYGDILYSRNMDFSYVLLINIYKKKKQYKTKWEKKND